MTDKKTDSVKPKQKSKKVRDKKQLGRVICWAIVAMLWIVASIIVAQYIVGFLMIMIIGQEDFLNPLPTAIFSALSYILAFLMIILLPPLFNRLFKNRPNHTKENKGKVKTRFVSMRTLGIDKWVTWTDIGLSIGGIVVYFILAAILLSIFSIFPWFNAEQAQNIGFNTNLYGLERMLAFLTLVVVAPIAEELIFRGYLYGKMREKFSQITSEIWSVIISALLVSIVFGIVHMQWNVGVNVFAMSLVACALREYTGTIYAGNLLHMIKNGLAFYFLFVLGIN
jgi:membrane protease YdiL (CAAX protease family)